MGNMKNMENEKYYTVGEIAAIHGVTVQSINHQIRKGALVGIKRGGRHLIKESDYAEFYEWYSALHPVEDEE